MHKEIYSNDNVKKSMMIVEKHDMKVSNPR